MVINEYFLHTTLHSILRDTTRLSTAESGFVMGQVFEGLEYLHGQGWIHEDLDPRSILVLDRDRLFVKVADFALSGMVDLGKPTGYHSDYASQKIAEKYDQYPIDIWSAGVVGLQLLEGVLPARSGYTLDRQCDYVVMLEKHVMLLSRTRTDDKGLHFLTRVLKSKYQCRPTATELLQDPWIQETKNYEGLQSAISRSITPQSSRHANVGPSSRVSSSVISRQTSKDRTARPLPNPTSQDDYNDLESEPETPTSRSSRFTANPLAYEPSLGCRTPMPYDSESNSGRLLSSPHSQSRDSEADCPVAHGEHESATPRSRHSAASPSQTTHTSPRCNANDELGQEDGSEKAESVKSQGPIKKKARKAPAIPSSGASSRPQGKKPALRRSGRHTDS